MKQKYLIACSGGPDSMALLDIYQKKHLIKAVIHINYNFRKSSIRDKNIVINYCNKHHLKLYIKNINPKIYKKNIIKNFEAWARKIRYEYFLLISNLTNTHQILMAHHLDDFIETSLMQITKHQFRNFYGIKKINYYKNLKIIRPFINQILKNDLINYCIKNKIKYGIDETNFDLKYERNYVRSILDKNKAKKIILLRLINELNLKLNNINKKINYEYNKWIVLDYQITYLKELNLNDQKYILKKYLYKNHIKNISLKKINNILQFIKSNLNNKKLRIDNHKFLIKNKKKLEIIN